MLIREYLDDYTRECLTIEVNTSPGGIRVVRVLEELKQRRGLPCQIRSDNGPEFISGAVDQWACEQGLQLAGTDFMKSIVKSWSRDSL